jgi:LuxR family maltose regulon positive regulatory protein
VNAHPQLLACHALALLMTGKIPQAVTLLENTLPACGKQDGRGALLAVKAWLGLVCGGSAGLRDMALQAIAELAPEDAIFRALALLSLGSGFQVSRNLSASNEAFQEAYSVGTRMQHPFAALAGLTNLVFNLLDMGQLRKAKAMCLDALPRFTDARGNPLPLQGMIAIPLAAIFLEQNDLLQARRYAQLGRDLCQRMFSSGMMGGDAEVVLAMVAFLEGDRDQAFAIADSMYRFAVEHQVAFLEDKMTALQADLYLRTGDFEHARQCQARLEIKQRTLMATVPQFKIMLDAELLSVQGHQADALELLEALEQEFQQEERARSLIRLLAFKVALLHQMGRRTDALESLAACIRLAAPEGYYRSLLRYTPGFPNLLREVRDLAPAFIDALLAALPAQTSGLEESAAKKSTPTSGMEALVEPLSEQECNVLRLLAAGLSNQEIANRLVISAGTAKWHVHNILSKLGATSRAQAAAMARDLGMV